MKIKKIYEFLDLVAPFNTSLDWDNSGFLIGNINDIFKNGLICLDITDEIIEESIKKQCNLIISHHPIIFNALNRVTSEMLVYKLIKNEINVISLHTNLDMAAHGVNFVLAKTLGLNNLSALNFKEKSYNYKLSILVPNEYIKEFIKNSENSGLIISINNLTSESDFYNKQQNNIKIEIIISKDKINLFIDEMVKFHPCKKPNYEITKIYDKTNFISLGLKGDLEKPLSPQDFSQLVKNKLKCKKISCIIGKRNISSVAVCGGAGSDLFKDIINKNIDAFVTAEIKYNIFIEAKKQDITLIDAGHFNTENVICKSLSDELNRYFNTDKFSVATNNIDIIEVI